MIPRKEDQRVDDRTGETADHEHTLFAPLLAESVCIELGDGLGDKSDGDGNDQDHGVTIQIIGSVGPQGGARLQRAENQGAQQDDSHVFVGLHTFDHVPEGIMLSGFLLLRVFQLHIVLLHLGSQGQHHEEEQNGGNDGDCPHGDAHVFADQEHPDDTGQNGADGAQDAFELQDAIPLGHVVRQGHDHGVHGHLHQRVGKIIQQIGDHEPGDLQSFRRTLGHQEEDHREDREEEEGGPVPGQVFPFTGQLAQKF